jgi:hypothetical protein
MVTVVRGLGGWSGPLLMVASAASWAAASFWLYLSALTRMA